MKNKCFEEIHSQILKYRTKRTAADLAIGKNIVRTDKKVIGLPSDEQWKIARGFLRSHKDLSTGYYLALLDEIFLTDIHDEFITGAKLFQLLPVLHRTMNLDILGRWIDKSSGWAEDDTLCQSTFTPKIILDRWAEWEKFIRSLSASKNIQQRRASLVLLVKPARLSNDSKIHTLSYEMIEKLKGEKGVEITKAISWLLRALSDTDKFTTKKYSIENKSTLPAIAYRETMKKIETGKKTGKIK